jgi:hypothetical protein
VSCTSLQRFRPSDDIQTFKIIKSNNEVVGIANALTTACENEVILVSPEEVIAAASLFGILEEIKRLEERGASFSMLTDVSYSAIEFVQEALRISEEVRHVDGYRGVYFAVLDRKTCLHGINLDIKHLSLAQPIAMLFSDDPPYAEYLIETFERLWGAVSSGSQSDSRAVNTRPTAELIDDPYTGTPIAFKGCF